MLADANIERDCIRRARGRRPERTTREATWIPKHLETRPQPGVTRRREPSRATRSTTSPSGLSGRGRWKVRQLAEGSNCKRQGRIARGNRAASSGLGEASRASLNGPTLGALDGALDGALAGAARNESVGPKRAETKRNETNGRQRPYEEFVPGEKTAEQKPNEQFTNAREQDESTRGKQRVPRRCGGQNLTENQPSLRVHAHLAGPQITPKDHGPERITAPESRLKINGRGNDGRKRQPEKSQPQSQLLLSGAEREGEARRARRSATERDARALPLGSGAELWYPFSFELGCVFAPPRTPRCGGAIGAPPLRFSNDASNHAFDFRSIDLLVGAH